MTILLVCIIAWLLGMVVLLILDDGHYSLFEVAVLGGWPVMLPAFQVYRLVRRMRYKKRQ